MKASSCCCGTQSVNQPNNALPNGQQACAEKTVPSLNGFDTSWYLLTETSAVLELWVYSNSVNCFPTKFQYISVKFKLIILSISSIHKATFTLHYFSLLSFSKYISNQWNLGNSIFCINSFEFKLGKYYIILNGEMKVFRSSMLPVHTDQVGE